MKKAILIFMICIAVLFIIAVIYTNDMIMNECLEVRIPVLTKREQIELESDRFFDDEETRKIYLSKGQTKRLLKKIKENSNWKECPINEKLNDKMSRFTRDNIYNEIPNIENGYWIFTNRSHGVEDKHNIDEMLNDLYYAISFGILDIDQNILYYYEYDR